MAAFNTFPPPSEIFIPLSDAQLAVLAEQVDAEAPVPTVQSRFNYAWGLLKSKEDGNVKMGINILTEMFKNVPSRRREFLYFLALGCFKLKEYRDAKRYVDVLINHSKSDGEGNSDVLLLKRMVDNELAKNSLIGFAIVSGGIAAAAGVASYFMKNKK
ncbi:Fis1 protein [Martiniozyma asiatica (nom. inval.)]|nr:Fis1 protein [Martiniozyma asiatica]